MKLFKTLLALVGISFPFGVIGSTRDFDSRSRGSTPRAGASASSSAETDARIRELSQDRETKPRFYQIFCASTKTPKRRKNQWRPAASQPRLVMCCVTARVAWWVYHRGRRAGKPYSIREVA